MRYSAKLAGTKPHDYTHPPTEEGYPFLWRLLSAAAFDPVMIKSDEFRRTAIRLSSPLEVGMNPKSEGILESSLYVNDVVGSARFYEKIFGFRTISDFGERGCAMQAGNRQVLLLFKKGGSRLIQSPHDGDGELHVAFAIPTSELSSWEAWLAENGIEVEEKRTWELGGKSVYFRDPDRHLIEIATPGVWSIY